MEEPEPCTAVERGSWRDLHAKEPLVEGSGEEGVQQVLMDQGQAQDAPAEAKPTTQHGKQEGEGPL